MTTTAVKPPLTPEERRQRWYARHTLPCYIHTKDKYGEAVYLVATNEDFGTIAVSILKQRASYGYYGDETWYFSGTLEEYYVEKLGMTTADAEALFASPLADKVDELKKLKTRFTDAKRHWENDQESIREQRTIKRILTRAEGTHPLHAIGILEDRSGYQYEYFSIERFEKP